MNSSQIRKCSEEVPLRLLMLSGWSYWLWQLVSGDHLRLYVHPRFVAPVLAAAFFLAALAVFQATRLIGVSGIKATPLPRARLIAYIVVLLPLVFGFALPPGGLGSGLAEKRDGFSTDAGGQVAAHALGELEDLLAGTDQRQQLASNQFGEFSYLLWQSPSRLIGSEVELSGFVQLSDTFAPGQFLLARYQISCCAADAIVVGCLCQLGQDQALPGSGWVTVQGRVVVIEYRSQEVGIIAIDSLLPIEPPNEAYVYK